MKILRCRQFSYLKINQITRCCSSESNSSNKFINPFLSNTKGYNPRKYEQGQNVASTQDPNFTSTENFSILFPPPNVTGNLHLGHALTATIQDVLIRWKHKQKTKTRWIPGTDHAGIASQVVVEKTLYKSTGKTRHDLTRDEFLAEMWKWKNEKKNSIVDDLRLMGTSFDWDHEYFTLDDNMSNAVNEAFIRLFDKKMIYRAEALINWSCSLESAISDVEVENLEIQGKTSIPVPNYEKNIPFGLISDVAYKVVGSDDEIVVSTTRPETLLGDVAVAVHPEDLRYSHLKDSKLWHPYRNEEIPIIFDESVDREFGTGAVKITPAHDKNDFDVAKRHKLSNVPVINEKGLIVDGYENFTGLKRFHAREKILNDLAEKKLFRGQKSHNMILPICSRSKDVIEFLLKPQWFVKCDEMARKAVEVVEQGKMKIHPKTFEREWHRWLSNSRDWCISRQLIWGHQIPVYQICCNDEEFWIAAKSQDEAEMKFKSQNPNSSSNFTIKRDPDVLDTWFSSGLLPFSVFGWPNMNSDAEKFFPLNLMETGHDILFFWVARMVMLSMELTGQVPFKEVLLHGIICDAFGRKMSKSLGNVISPLQVINGASLSELQNETRDLVKRGILSESELEISLDGQKKMYPNGIKECGIDALRFTLLSSNVKQHFISFDHVECHTNSKFLNKVYNSFKFANSLAEICKIDINEIKNFDGLNMSEMDRWLLSRLGRMIKTFEKSMENFNFHLATAALKTFLYDECCNIYIETAKTMRLKAQSDENKNSAIVLNSCFGIACDYLEVFTPFFVKGMRKVFPKNVEFDPEKFIDEKLEKRIENVLEICENIRIIKAECRLTRKIPSEVHVLAKSTEIEEMLNCHVENIKNLTFSEEMKISSDVENFNSKDFLAISTAGHLCSVGIIILNKQSEAFETSINHKKITKLQYELEKMLKISNHASYQENANEKVKQKHQEKINRLKQEIEAIQQLI